MSIVMLFLPTMKKRYTISLKFGRIFVMRKKRIRTPCHWGAWPYLYTYMASILILNLIILCLIRGFVVGLIVMMNPYWQGLAFRLWCLGFHPCQLCNLTYHRFILGVLHWAILGLWPRPRTSELALRGRTVCSPCPGRKASTWIAIDFE